jgi:D-serine deaminase-like pyridoxal phosphate-dependent protein
MPKLSELNPADWLPTPEDLKRMLTPCLLIDLDKVRSNTARILSIVDDNPERWRPHVKTTKTPEVWAELAALGLRNFKCATTREADLLGETLTRCGTQNGDILVAYPLVGPSLTRLAEIASQHKDVSYSVLVEESTHLVEIPDHIDFFVDINPGMNRTGVPIDESDLILEIAAAAGERFRGFHFYDGHQHDMDLGARERAIHAGYDQLLSLRARALEAGLKVGEIITSGTPALLHAARYEPLKKLEGTLHRVSPGTVVFHDQRSEEENPELQLLPAATVLTRVVSHPAPGVITCDAGSKAVASEAGDPIAVILGHPEWTPMTPNEEHLPIQVTGDRPPRGTELLLVPRHICPTVNLAEEAALIEGGRLKEVVRVAARAHELLAD